MKLLVFFISIFLLSSALLISQEYDHIKYRSFAASNKTLRDFNSKYDECCASGEIDCVRCGDYAASDINLSQFINRYNKLMINDYGSSEFKSLLAASNLSFDEFSAKMDKNKSLIHEYGELTVITYILSKNDMKTIISKIDEINSTYPNFQFASLYYALSNHKLDIFIKRYNEISKDK